MYTNTNTSPLYIAIVIGKNSWFHILIMWMTSLYLPFDTAEVERVIWRI